MTSASEIANYIIKKSIAKRKYVNNWKIQFLLYYIQQKCIEKNGTKAFEDIMVAWKWGPVVPSVKMDIEKKYGPLNIKKANVNDVNIEDAELRKLIDSVMKDYSGMDFVEMSKTEAKDPNSLWNNTYDGGNGRNQEIKFVKG